nr:zinc finger protein 34-like [Rhipicephalus microplus]
MALSAPLWSPSSRRLLAGVRLTSGKAYRRTEDAAAWLSRRAHLVEQPRPRSCSLLMTPWTRRTLVAAALATGIQAHVKEPQLVKISGPTTAVRITDDESSHAHLPIRKRITLRIQESADVLEEWGLAGEVVVNEAAEAVVEVKAAVERNTCQYCSKRFNSSSKHRLHELRHRSKLDGRYRCIKCGKCFVQNSSLMTHVRSHTGERPYHCKVCGADFGDVSCYNKHKRTHTGDRPYNCFGCAKAFTQSGNLYRHMRICAKVKNMAPNLA